MKKALIIYGSTTGNTESMAEMIQQALQQADVESSLKDVSGASVEELTTDTDIVLLGCPAYGDDTIELQDDFAEFYEKFDGLNLQGHKYAVFAPGDESYEFFCGSVDMIEDKIKELGGTLVESGLKVEGDPKQSSAEISKWATDIAGRL